MTIRFVAVGTHVEDTRGDRPDVCRVFWGPENVGSDNRERTYVEACIIARKIADVLNNHRPDINARARE